MRSKRLPPTLTFRIDPKIRKTLRKLADERHMSEGALVALFVEEGLARGKGLEERVSKLEEWMWERIRELSPEQSAPDDEAAPDADDGEQAEADRLD